MDIQHRITGEVYFVTDTVVDWVDIFTRPIFNHVILESLAYCHKNKGLIIYAWVLMSNHLPPLAHDCIVWQLSWQEKQ
jgi:hypothetical protein